MRSIMFSNMADSSKAGFIVADSTNSSALAEEARQAVDRVGGGEEGAPPAPREGRRRGAGEDRLPDPALAAEEDVLQARVGLEVVPHGRLDVSHDPSAPALRAASCHCAYMTSASFSIIRRPVTSRSSSGTRARTPRPSV